MRVAADVEKAMKRCHAAGAQAESDGDNGKSQMPELKMPSVRGPRQAPSVRLAYWLLTWLERYDHRTRMPAYPHWLWRTRRVVRWVLTGVPKARKFLIAIFGGFVARGTHAERMVKCAGCKQLQKQVRLSWFSKPRLNWFCGVCGCGHWWAAELHRKNRLKRAYCPDRLHPGPYPEDAWSHLLEADGTESLQ